MYVKHACFIVVRELKSFSDRPRTHHGSHGRIIEVVGVVYRVVVMSEYDQTGPFQLSYPARHKSDTFCSERMWSAQIRLHAREQYFCRFE
jgi:hypothetical protein